MKIVPTAAEAVLPIESGHRIYVHEAAMAPVSLLSAMTERARALTDVEVVHLHTNAPAPYVDPSLRGHVRHNALFVGPNVRAAVNDGLADFTPVFLSEVPSLFRDGTLPLDVGDALGDLGQRGQQPVALVLGGAERALDRLDLGAVGGGALRAPAQ